MATEKTTGLYKAGILQLIPALGAGGAEQGCVDMARGIVDAGGRAYVMSCGGPRVAEVEAAGAEHITVPLQSKNPFQMMRNAERIALFCQQNHIQIIHARSRAPAWCGQMAAEKMPDVRFMTTCHAPYFYNNPLKKKYNAVMCSGEKIIAISDYVAALMQQNFAADPNKIHVIPRGIDLSRFNPDAVSPDVALLMRKSWGVPMERKMILLPGRLTDWKGQHVLIKAMAKIKDKEVIAVCVGDDQGRTDYRRHLEDLIARYRLQERVFIASHSPDIVSAYALSDIVVCPSTKPEGFGRVPVEAQIMRKPIIAAAHGGAAETVLENGLNRLVPPGDSSALAQAIDDVLAQLPAENMLEEARAHVLEKYTLDRMVAATLQVYKELLGHGEAMRHPRQRAGVSV